MGVGQFHNLFGGQNGAQRVGHVGDGNQLGALAGVTGTVTALGLSEDGTRLVASSDDKHVRGWTISGAPNNLAADLDMEHPEAVLEVSLAKDKARLVTVAADGVVRAWDVAPGLMLENFQVHEGAATTASCPEATTAAARAWRPGEWIPSSLVTSIRMGVDTTADGAEADDRPAARRRPAGRAGTG